MRSFRLMALATLCLLTVTLPSITAQQAPPPQGPVAHWRLDEPANPSFDNAGGHTGFWSGGVFPVPGGAPPIQFPNPGHLFLDGGSGHVVLGNPGTLPSGFSARTLCGWGRPASLAGGYGWIAAFGNPSGSQAMFIGKNGNTLFAGGYGNDLIVPGAWDMNWHHIALVYEGGNPGLAHVYKDGVLLQSGLFSWNLIPNFAYLGRQVNHFEYWHGDIDDVRIYGRALSPGEVAYLAAGSPAPTGLVATSQPGRVALTWNPIPGATYNVRRGTSPGVHATIATGVPGSSFTDGTAAVGTTYFYVVTAASPSDSTPSNESSAAAGPSSVPLVKADVQTAVANPSYRAVLTSFLDNAVLRVNQGQHAAAISLLRSFTTYVTKYVTAGAITPNNGAALLGQANFIISVLQGIDGGLRLSWRFEELSGPASDTSGSGNTGTLFNGPPRVAGGKVGRAVSFNGFGQFVNAGPGSGLTMSGALSMSAWIFPTGPGTGGMIINKEGEYEITRFGDQQIWFALANSGPGWNWVPTGIFAPDNVWTHVALTYSASGGQINAYANGNPAFSIAGSGAIGDVDPFFNDLRVAGRQSGTQDFQGVIDEVRVYNRALSGPEVGVLAGKP
jgi:hypothetical protein